MSQPSPEATRYVATKYPGVYAKGNRYMVRWRHKGRMRAKSFRTLSEARAHKARVDGGASAPTSREPFRSYALRWVDEYGGRTSRGVSERTRESYRDSIERYAVPFFQSARLDHIDTPLLGEYVAKLASRKLAPSSVRRHFAVMRALLAD